MKSKKFKEIIQEVADELDLPYSAVHDAVTFNFNQFREQIEAINMKEVLTHEEYEAVPKVIHMKGFGSFTLHKETKVLNKNKHIKNKYYDKVKKDEVQTVV